ncbi:MAG TPA: hypothetical protein EYF95_07595 [Flavobacteriales bacterium]|nr:hypothetical protein [Flavobacteriales bacterium]
MILGNSLFQTEVLFNAASDMPAGNTGTPYTGCFENGTITIDSSKRYTTNLDMARCGKRGVKIGSPPNASGTQHFPRNWGYSCWNNGSERSGYVIALHRYMLPSGSVAPEYDTNNPQKKSSIYAIIEIPNASDGTVPTSAERSAFLSSIGTALSEDNVNFGTVTSECGVLPVGVTTDPECTTDTYLGGWSNVDCGGYPSDGGNPDDKKKCGTYSDSTLVAGDTYKYKQAWGGGYTTKTVPAGTIICTYDVHNLPNRSNQWREDHPLVDCTVDEDKVLGRGWGQTNGVWECIPKLGCKDLHNTNYAPESERTHKSSVCDAGTCISGAAKMLLGSGDGSCIKELDMFVLEKSASGCCTQTGYDDCKCRYQVALGKSGWGGHIVTYRNFEGPSGQTCEAGTCDQWKSGRSGMARFDTLADAQAAFDTMKAGAQQAMGTTGSDGDDDDDDNGITPDLCESVICSDLNRDDHADAEPLYDTSVQDCCGECSTGYEEDDNGECQAVNGDEETPWLLYGGVGLAALVGLLILKK